jgi:hypothetical protein
MAITATPVPKPVIPADPVVAKAVVAPVKAIPFLYPPPKVSHAALPKARKKALLAMKERRGRTRSKARFH